MLILGLLLVVLSVAAGVLLIAYNGSGGPEQAVMLFGRELTHVNALQAFIAGMVVALVFCVGWWLVASASRRRAAIRSDYRAARREARTAAAERDQLARELERERANGTTAEPAAPVRTEPVAEETGESRGIGRHFRLPRRTTATSTGSDQSTK